MVASKKLPQPSVKHYKDKSLFKETTFKGRQGGE